MQWKCRVILKSVHPVMLEIMTEDAGVSCKGTGSIRLLCLYARSLSVWIISETNHYMIFYMGLNQTTLGMIQF